MIGHAHCLSLALLCVLLAFAGVVSSECNSTRYLELMNITISEVTCYGGSDATLSIDVQDDDSGCTFNLYTLKGEQQVSSKKEFTGISAGEYELIVKFEDAPSAKTTVTVGSAAEMTYTSTVEDFNNLVCDECLAEATIVMSGGVGPYKFDGEIYENATFKLSWLCYGNTSFTVSDDNGCVVHFMYELPIPVWCLMVNESSSSSSRDYWTLPDGMLPWLIAVCAVVAVFIIAAFVACICWSCLSERTPSEPKQKLLEQGNKPQSPGVENARVHDYDSGREASEKNAESGMEEEPESAEEEPEKKEEPAPQPEHEEETKEKKEPKKKDKKKKKKKHHGKKHSADPEGGEVEMDLMADHALASDESEHQAPKKKEKRKKHKAEPAEPAESTTKEEPKTEETKTEEPQKPAEETE